MRTRVVVLIECDELDIRDRRAFERAAEFSRYTSTITIRTTNGMEVMYSCDPHHGTTCWGWRWFKHGWERKYGPI